MSRGQIVISANPNEFNSLTLIIWTIFIRTPLHEGIENFSRFIFGKQAYGNSDILT